MNEQGYTPELHQQRHAGCDGACSCCSGGGWWATAKFWATVVLTAGAVWLVANVTGFGG